MPSSFSRTIRQSAEALLDLKEFACFLLVEWAVALDVAIVTENLDPVLQMGDIHHHHSPIQNSPADP